MQDNPTQEDRGTPRYPRFRLTLELVKELSATLPGSSFRRADGLPTQALVLELRAKGKNNYLVLSAHPRLRRVHLTQGLPTTGKPFPLVEATRKVLQGTRCNSVLGDVENQRLDLEFGTATGSNWTLSWLGEPRDIVLFDPKRRLHVSIRGRAQPPSQDPRPKARPDSEPHGPIPQEKSPSLALDRLFANAEDLELQRLLLREGRDLVKGRLKSVRRRSLKLRDELENAESGVKAKWQGELLSANYPHLRRGLREIEVIDYFAIGTPKVRIPLDPKRSPQENVERLFKRAKRAARALPLIHEKIERARSEINELEQANSTLKSLSAPTETTDSSEISNAVEQILARLVDGGFIRIPSSNPAKKRAKKPGSGPSCREPRRFRSSDGIELLVGRNDRENDRLVRTVARGEDFWLHARDVPGSHVIVRLPKGMPLPEETLVDAATLAAHFSRAQDWEKVDVVYTKRKYLHRRKGAPLGQVTYSKASTMMLRRDSARVDRLLGRLFPGRKKE